VIRKLLRWLATSEIQAAFIHGQLSQAKARAEDYLRGYFDGSAAALDAVEKACTDKGQGVEDVQKARRRMVN
jgi:hypothetical protein